MVKAKDVVLLGFFGLLGYLAVKETMTGAKGHRRTSPRRNRGGRAIHPLGNGSLGRAEAYTDAFPEEGLGGLDPGR